MKCGEKFEDEPITSLEQLKEREEKAAFQYRCQKLQEREALIHTKARSLKDLERLCDRHASLVTANAIQLKAAETIQAKVESKARLAEERMNQVKANEEKLKEWQGKLHSRQDCLKVKVPEPFNLRRIDTIASGFSY